MGDSYDLLPAIKGSVADVFVTYDERLAEMLSRVPIENFRVLSSILELLDLSHAAGTASHRWVHSSIVL